MIGQWSRTSEYSYFSSTLIFSRDGRSTLQETGDKSFLAWYIWNAGCTVVELGCCHSPFTTNILRLILSGSLLNLQGHDLTCANVSYLYSASSFCQSQFLSTVLATDKINTHTKDPQNSLICCSVQALQIMSAPTAISKQNPTLGM